ncbi:MAG: DUF1330 domain-containing protein [Actinomycetota bacterium]
MVDHLHDETIDGLEDQPVVMLNLMRFRAESADGDGSGWDAYVRYSRMANALIRERGGRIMWAGWVKGTTLGPAEHGNWDYAALVRYPSPIAFGDMVRSAAYAEANVHRDNGCEDHLIMAVDEAYNGLAS